MKLDKKFASIFLALVLVFTTSNFRQEAMNADAEKNALRT
jgi:hypothetical protein